MPTPSELMLLLLFVIFFLFSVFVILSSISLLFSSSRIEKNIYKKQKLLIASACRPPPSLHRYAQQACYYYYFVRVIISTENFFLFIGSLPVLRANNTKQKRNSVHTEHQLHKYKYHNIVFAIRTLRTTISTQIREKAYISAKMNDSSAHRQCCAKIN